MYNILKKKLSCQRLYLCNFVTLNSNSSKQTKLNNLLKLNNININRINKNNYSKKDNLNYKISYSFYDVKAISPYNPKPLISFIATTVHRRTLNKSTLLNSAKKSRNILFESELSNKLIIESIKDGLHNSFYKLIQQFSTQDDPTFCGISTLVLVLNALLIDPQRRWKGIWRWFNEHVLYCVDTNKVQSYGTNIEEFVTIGNCNNLFSLVFRPDNNEETTFEYFKCLIFKNANRNCVVESHNDVSSGICSSEKAINILLNNKPKAFPAFKYPNTPVRHDNFNNNCKQISISQQFLHTSNLYNLEKEKNVNLYLYNNNINKNTELIN